MPHWRPYSLLPSLNPPSHLSTPSQPALHSLPLNSKLFPSLILLLARCLLPDQALPEKGNPFLSLLSFSSFFFFKWPFNSCPSCHFFPPSISSLKTLQSYKSFLPLDFPVMSSYSSFGLIPVEFSGILAINKLLNVQKKHRMCGFMMTNAGHYVCYKLRPWEWGSILFASVLIHYLFKYQSK